jgi:hypothetical protein
VFLRDKRGFLIPLAPALTALLLALLYLGLNHYFHFKDDNLVEEIIEEGIFWTTGREVDLTPMSPEHRKFH